MLEKLFQHIDIVQEVYQEVVVQGHAFPDSHSIQEAIDRGVILVCSLEDAYAIQAKKLITRYAIDMGEAATIALALQQNVQELIIDEISARFVAEAHNLKPFGSLRVLALAFKKDLITKPQLEEIVAHMLQSKYRMSASVLFEFWRGIQEIEKQKRP